MWQLTMARPSAAPGVSVVPVTTGGGQPRHDRSLDLFDVPAAAADGVAHELSWQCNRRARHAHLAKRAL